MIVGEYPKDWRSGRGGNALWMDPKDYERMVRARRRRPWIVAGVFCLVAALAVWWVW